MNRNEFVTELEKLIESCNELPFYFYSPFTLSWPDEEFQLDIIDDESFNTSDLAGYLHKHITENKIEKYEDFLTYYRKYIADIEKIELEIIRPAEKILNDIFLKYKDTHNITINTFKPDPYCENLIFWYCIEISGFSFDIHMKKNHEIKFKLDIPETMGATIKCRHSDLENIALTEKIEAVFLKFLELNKNYFALKKEIDSYVTDSFKRKLKIGRILNEK
jgi:hypothetical protein